MLPGRPGASQPRFGFHLNVHDRPGSMLFGRETRRLLGLAELREQVAGASYLVSPTAFFQTNVDAAAILVELVRGALAPGAPILDLYAGAGLFALPLAQAGHPVVAVEENAVAVEDGEASRARNRVPPERCRWVAGTVESALAGLGAFDTVILDPPRDGCSPAVREQLFARRRPPLVVYVSCDPETLARDLAAAGAQDYSVDSLQPVDMFPHTAHIETVAVLTRNSETVPTRFH
jgi:23S rRNA (uracil1939-C5)-methyltransferase